MAKKHLLKVSKSITKENLNLQTDLLVGPMGMAFDITNKCNLDCKHCYNRSGRNYYLEANKELTDDEIRILIDDSVKMKPRIFCFCGGEPLLRKNILLESAKKLSEAGIYANLVTNGLLLTKAVAKQLKDSGINLIQVSLDGATAESHDKLRNRKGAFKKALQAIENAKEADFFVTTSCMPTKFNFHEFDEIIALNKKLGVNEVNLQPLMPLGECISFTSEIIPSESENRDIVTKITQIRSTNREPKITWGDPIDHFIRFSTFQKEPCLHVEVRANGDISSSFYMALVLGNIRKHSIIDYWESGFKRIWGHPILQLISQKYRSVSDLAIQQPASFFEAPLEYDIIDDPGGENEKILINFFEASIDWRREHEPYWNANITNA